MVGKGAHVTFHYRCPSIYMSGYHGYHGYSVVLPWLHTNETNIIPKRRLSHTCRYFYKIIKPLKLLASNNSCTPLPSPPPPKKKSFKSIRIINFFTSSKNLTMLKYDSTKIMIWSQSQFLRHITDCNRVRYFNSFYVVAGKSRDQLWRRHMFGYWQQKWVIIMTCLSKQNMQKVEDRLVKHASPTLGRVLWDWPLWFR